MFCKLCGKYNPDTEKQCKYCGGPLSINQEVPIRQNSPYYYGQKTITKKVCSRCGRENKTTNKLCNYCGGPLTIKKQAIPNTNVVRQEENFIDRSTSGFWLGFLFSLLGLAIGLLTCKGSYEKDTFLSGWAKGFIISIILGVVLYFCIVGCATCAIVGRY